MIAIPVLALLGFLGYKMIGGAPDPGVELPNKSLEEMVSDGVDSASAVASNVTTDNLKVPGMGADDIKSQLSNVFGSYKETLGGISDVESAKEAVPEMKSLNDQLGSVAGMMDKLPAGVKDALGGSIGSMIEPIKEMLDKVMKIPGVEPILKPVVDTMLEKVGLLSGS